MAGWKFYRQEDDILLYFPEEKKKNRPVKPSIQTYKYSQSLIFAIGETKPSALAGKNLFLFFLCGTTGPLPLFWPESFLLNN